MNLYDDIFDRLVGERYRVKSRLGAGAFGQVFLATHEIFDISLRTVALKLFTKDYVTRKNARTVFKEALIMESLAARERARGDDLHIVAIYDIGTIPEYQHIPFVAMEFVDGGSLEVLLEKAGRLPLTTVIKYSREIAAGLSLAHRHSPQPLIHRDIKPANVLLTTDHFIKISDFGVAVDRTEGYMQGGGGTVTYAPPELRDGGPAEPSYDVYALGLTMIEMLIGHNPLNRVAHRAKEKGLSMDSELELAQEKMARLEDPETGRPFGEICAELGEAKQFKEVLVRCLAINPKARHQDAVAVDRALAECQGTGKEKEEEPVETLEEEIRRLLRAGNRSLSNGELEMALGRFEQVRRMEPRNPQAFFGLSRVFEKMNRVADAVQAQEVGADLLRNSESLTRLAELYEQADDSGKAGAARLMAKMLAGKKTR